MPQLYPVRWPIVEAMKHTSSRTRSSASAAGCPPDHTVLCVCIEAFGIPVVPDV